MGRKSVPWPPNFSSSRKRKRRKEKQRQPWTCRSQSTPQPGDPRRAQRHLRGTSLSPFPRSHLREFARAALPQQRTLAGSDDSTPGGWPVTASSGLAPSRAPPAASGSSLASARPLVFAGITSVAPRRQVHVAFPSGTFTSEGHWPCGIGSHSTPGRAHLNQPCAMTLFGNEATF